MLQLDSTQATTGTFLLTSALQQNCALTNSPLRIEAKSGQQINITMIDATLTGMTSSRDDSACPVKVGEITDKANAHAQPVCGGKQRRSTSFV